MNKIQKIKSCTTQMGGDLADLQQRLSELRERIPVLQAELARIDSNLPDADGGIDTKLDKADLLTRRAILLAELDSLPGQARELRFRAVHADILFLCQQRELFRAEATKAAVEYYDLDSDLSERKLQKQHLTVMRRHGHLGQDEAAAQIEPLTAELRTTAPAVQTAKGQMIRAQSRAGGLGDTCKTRYRVGLDAAPEKVDEAAGRLAEAEREAVFLLCFPRWQPKPWQSRG